MAFTWTAKRYYFLAVTVISMCPAPTSLATTTVVRVGRGSLKYDLYTAFMRGEPVFKKYKSLQDAQREFDRLCGEALDRGCSWEHHESTHGRIVIDFTNWPSIALW